VRRITTFFAASALAVLMLTVAVLPSSAQAQTRGGTLRLIVQPEPPLLIPFLNQLGPTTFVAGKMYESLLTWSFDLTPQPGLAKSWEISPDGLTYTFYLQDGVTWHDGKPFNADDVVFSISELMAKVHPRARVVLGKILDKVEKLDDLTVRVTLLSPFPAFIQMFEPNTGPMIPAHIYAGTDYAQHPANQTPIGTGPFKFKEWKRGEYIRLERYANYWQAGKPYLDELIFRIIPDSASRAVAFERGTVDALRGNDVDNIDVKRLRALPGVQYSTQGFEMFAPQAFLIFNQHQPPFDNVKVRHAVMAAMNRQFILNNILFGWGKVATGPFAYTEKFYDPNTPPIVFDMKKARALLKESGINPRDYTIRHLNVPYGPTWERLDEYTRQVLEQLGFNVSAEMTDAGGWGSRTGNWDFDLTTVFLYQYGDPALGVSRLYVSENIVKGSPFANVQGYRNAAADALWADAARELDPAKRQALYSQIQTMLVNDMANGFLIDMEFPTLWHGRVKNLVQTAIGLNETMADVYLEP